MRVRSDPVRYRWVLWGVLGVVFLLVNIYRLSTAVLAEDLMAAFETTGVRLGTLHAIFFYVYALMQIPTGLLADRVGPRRTATAGAFVMSIGAIWFALADTYLAALVARGLVGLGGSVIFVCILRFCASWYRDDEFATMSGLSFAVSGVGGVLATTPLALAVDAAGWRETVLALGVFGLAFSAVVYLFVRDTPERAGGRPIDGVPDRPTLSARDLRASTTAVLGDRVVWVVSAMLFCTTGLNLTLFGLWGVPYVVQTYGVSTTYASTFTLAGSVGLIVGPPAFGLLSDRLEWRTELMIGGGVWYVLALGSIALLGAPPQWLVALVFFSTGAGLGAFVLSYAVVKERHPAEASGVSTGTINGAAFLGGSVLPALMGWALDTYWTGDLVGGVRVYTSTGYRMAFVIATLAAGVALACALWLHRHERRTRRA
ncbi:MFS transporter [Natronobiforma cellulositropha]|uniref:MFS transporter n=1 Tax=Natronobiforma cellulositropha TaxID=1679076 RepID=UPI0021D5BD7B|nr:MFS transporter [Natronobiforma cellulositropha]